MKKGDVFYCPECGLQLKVIKECEESDTPADECACHAEASACTFSCCGNDLIKK
jgi:hypothetical protein